MSFNLEILLYVWDILARSTLVCVVIPWLLMVDSALFITFGRAYFFDKVKTFMLYTTYVQMNKVVSSRVIVASAFLPRQLYSNHSPVQ